MFSRVRRVTVLVSLCVAPIPLVLACAARTVSGRVGSCRELAPADSIPPAPVRVSVAPLDSPSVHVHTLDRDGHAHADVYATLAPLGDTASRIATVPALSGRFIDVAPGQYWLTVRRIGFVARTHRLTVEPQSHLRVDVPLAASPTVLCKN